MNKEKSLEDSGIVEILGAFIGDGWIEKRGTALYITGSPTEDKEYYDSFLAPLFSTRFVKVWPKAFPYWGVYGIVTYKKRIIRRALKLGFQSGKKSHIAKIPSEIMKSENKNLMRAVIRGIFDTDGCFMCQKAYGKSDGEWEKAHNCKPKIQIGTVSKILSTQICDLLSKLKIDCKMSFSEGGFKCNRNTLTLNRVLIYRRKSIEKWFQVIGTNNPRHRTRYLVWKKQGHLPPYTTIEDRKRILTKL